MTEGSNGGTTGRLSKTVVMGVFLLAVLVIPAVVVLWRGERGEDAPPARAPDSITPAAASKLVLAKNVANAYLENEQYSEAHKHLVVLAETVPDELLPVRNLAICRLLAWQNMQARGAQPVAEAEQSRVFGSEEEAAELTRAAVAELRDRQDTVLPFWLLGQIQMLEASRASDPAVRQQKQTEAVQTLQEASQNSPSDVVVRYALFEAARLTGDEQFAAISRDALREAYQLQPENIALLRQWLEVQAQQQDAQILETLEAAQQVVAPLTARGLDLDKYLTQAREAAEAGDWSKVRVNVTYFNNLIKGEEFAKSDLKRIQPHPLTFVMHDFSPNFYENYQPERLPDAEMISVNLKRNVEDGQLPELSDVQAMQLADFDLDERTELLVLRGDAVEVYGRGSEGEGWQQTERHDVPAGMQHLQVADLYMVDLPSAPQKPAPQQNAGAANSAQPPAVADSRRHNTYPGLVLYGEAGIQLMRHEPAAGESDATLRPVEQDGGLQELGRVHAALPVDLDHDGDLDLVLAAAGGISLWANRGNMVFDDVSQWSWLPPADMQFTSLVQVDLDRDLDLDVVMTGPGNQQAGMLENLRHARMKWRAFSDEFAAISSSQSLALLDADANGGWDFAAGGDEGVFALFTAPARGAVRHLRTQTINSSPARGVRVWDYNNDSYQDLVAWGDAGVAVYRGSRDGALTADEGVLSERLSDVRDCQVADLDQDGDLDLVVQLPAGVVCFDNEGGSQNHWLAIRVRGKEDNVSGRVNHFGIGSLIEVRTGTRYQAQVITQATTHFGLGAQSQADVARLLLTNGIPQAVVRPAADQTLREEMILKGSCPYLYTWDGERWQFYTDLLWASPIGLQFAPGELAPARPWEYLKIDGDALRMKEGRYQLQITEELWEAAYFDQVELIAVDHPADVEIFSNEKVGPAEIAQFKVHTVRDRRTPVAARDAQGRDVLHQLRKRDGQYLQAFEHTRRQGLTGEHYVELDLGALEDPEQIMLYLTGWIWPTDTSLNIAIAQDPRLDRPRPPAIQVPDADGKWQEVVPYMGFPGGKTKTIAVDLSDIFLADDYRLRIVTTSQIYWDEAFFTIGDQAAPVKLTPLTLETADLHYRGVSAMLPREANSPHWYDYEQVERAPAWPPMEGMFTRYGDVRELVAEVDAMSVVMGSGDEMTLAFIPPAEPLPEGWRRDFLLHNVGWDKDADLNTVTGQSVEPLPFVGMKSYPYAADEDFPDTAAHRRYLREYQTRRQDGRFWSWLLR